MVTTILAGVILAWGSELDASHYSLKQGTDPCVVSVRGASLHIDVQMAQAIQIIIKKSTLFYEGYT